MLNLLRLLQVGKSTVTKILADYLEVSYEEDQHGSVITITGPKSLRLTI